MHTKLKITILTLLLILISAATFSTLSQPEQQSPKTTDELLTQQPKKSQEKATVIIKKIEQVGDNKVEVVEKEIDTTDNSNAAIVIPLDSNEVEAFAIKYRGYPIKYSFDGIAYETVLPSADGPQDKYELVSDLIYIERNQTDKVYIIPTGELQSVEIDTIPRDENPQPATNFATAAYEPNQYSGAMMTKLNIIPRTVWGANTSSWDPNSSMSINNPDRLTWDPHFYKHTKVLIHHTATPFNSGNPYKSVKDIYLYHAYSRGWGDIGYSYLVDPDGRIYEGKLGGTEVYSYQAYREASMTGVSIALIGNYSTAHPTTAALNAVASIVAEQAAIHNLDIKSSNGSLSHWEDGYATVFGHRDSYFYCHPGHPLAYRCTSGNGWRINTTGCPGTHFHSKIPTDIVSKAKTRLANYTDYIDQRRQTEQWLGHLKYDQNIFWVQFKEGESTTMPKFSGMTILETNGQYVKVAVYDWHSGGHVPHYGYTGGFNGILPMMQGPLDRMLMLTTYFALRDDVEDVYFEGTTKSGRYTPYLSVKSAYFELHNSDSVITPENQ